MTSNSIPLDKVQSEIAKINLEPKLETLLADCSEWLTDLMSEEGSFMRHHAVYDYLEDSESGILLNFLEENGISIRPSGFEFYRIEEESEV